MIEVLQFIATFCFWLFLAAVMLGLCIVSIWVLAGVVKAMRERDD